MLARAVTLIKLCNQLLAPAYAERDTEESVVKWLKKTVVAIVVIFVAFYLFSRPEDSADAVKNAFTAVGNGVGSLVTFFTSLSSS